MTFLHPKALLWALLAVPVVLLYLWNVPPRRHMVAAGFLWEQVFSSPYRRSAWWPLRQAASLGLQLLVLALLVAAAAGPQLGLSMHPPLRMYLAGAGLAAVVAEWYFFQRRWTC